MKFPFSFFQIGALCSKTFLKNWYTSERFLPKKYEFVAFLPEFQIFKIFSMKLVSFEPP